MSKVDYNIELFNLVKDLASISNIVMFEKDENNNVFVRRADSEGTIAYELKAPSNYFDFDKDMKIAFYSYLEFYQYLKAFGEPDILIEENNCITLKFERSKCDYGLNHPDSIPAGPKSINFKNPDVKVNLTSESLDEILKMIGLINAKKVDLKSVDGKLTIKVFSGTHFNTFEKIFDLEEISEEYDDFEFSMFADTFKDLPSKGNYVMEIKSQGYVKISLIDDNVSLDIYTGRVKK